jgi:azobenzene reductase
MRIMVICGSLRQASGTRAALQIAAGMLRTAGATVDFYDLGQHRFPLYDPDAESLPPEVADFRERVMAADAYLIGSPEYHNGMSGALKNAIDYIGSRYVKDKPVALLVCAGGEKGGMNALANLRTVMRGIRALVIPDQVVVDEDDFDGEMNLTNEGRRTRIEELVAALVRYTKLMALEKAGV